MKDIKILPNKKKTKGEQMPEKDIKVLLKKKKKKDVSIIRKRKQKLLEYRRNYYLTHKK